MGLLAMVERLVIKRGGDCRAPARRLDTCPGSVLGGPDDRGAGAGDDLLQRRDVLLEGGPAGP